EDDSDYRPRRKKKGGIALRHLVPAFLLLLPIAGFCAHDVFVKAIEDRDAVKITEPEEKIDWTPRIALRMQDNGADHGYPRAVEPMGLLGATMRFGLIMAQEFAVDPKTQRKEYKKLTYMDRGLTNNT